MHDIFVISIQSLSNHCEFVLVPIKFLQFKRISTNFRVINANTEDKLDCIAVEHTSGGGVREDDVVQDRIPPNTG